MANDMKVDCVDTPVTQLVELFRGQLAEVKFPGVDATALDVSIKRVTARAEEVEGLLAALASARDALQAEQRTLRDQARQAHAYARVFATGDSALNEQLDQIVFDAPKRAPRKPKARRSKGTAPQLVLDNESTKRATSAAS